MRNLHQEAIHELEEIEWVEGLRPMPQHLIDLGTRTYTYTQEIKILQVPEAKFMSENSPPTLMVEDVDYEVVSLPQPITETYVWGEQL